MTDEERRKLVEKLKESTGMQVSYWTCLRAANEIERLANALQIEEGALAICGFELNRHIESCQEKNNEIERLAAERDAALSTLAAVRERLELRVSELERK